MTKAAEIKGVFHAPVKVFIAANNEDPHIMSARNDMNIETKAGVFPFNVMIFQCLITEISEMIPTIRNAIPDIANRINVNDIRSSLKHEVTIKIGISPVF